MSEVFNDLHTPVVTTIWSWANGSDLLNYIQGELKAGKAVTVATTGTVSSSSPLVASHAYMVDHVNFRWRITSTGTLVQVPVSVTLRNPWGYDGVSDGSDFSDGYVTVSLADASSSFDTVQSAVV